MSFITPLALGLAAVAVVPVVMHLFRRDTTKRVSFPAIRYLRRARDRSARALKLRDRLLLLTRAGLVFVLAAAAAGPLVGRGDASNHLPTDMVILLDNSGSMNRIAGDTALLDRQRSRALELLDAGRANDRFWVLPAVGPVLEAGTAAGAAAGALGRVEATDAVADLRAGLREAVRLLPPGEGRQREIVVLTDGQASALSGVAAEPPADIRIVVSRIRASDRNSAVVDLIATPPAAGGDGIVAVHLATTAEVPGPDTVEIRLTVGGATVSIGRATVGGSAILRLPDPGVGEYAVAAEIPPSGLRADDRRHLVLRTAEPPAVRHAGPSGSYVGQALGTLVEAGRLGMPGSDDDPAAWFVEGVPPDGLRAAPGTAIILTPPTDDALLARFNSALDRLGIPWRIDVSAATGNVNLEPSPDVAGLDSIRLSGRHMLASTEAGPDSVHLRTSQGAPWAVAGRTADLAYLVIASPLVPEHADLPIDALMLPFMEAVLFRWMGLGASLPAPVPAGTAARLPAQSASLSLPDGRSIGVDGGSPYTPLTAGIHTVVLGNGATSLLAVVVPASESDLSEVSATGLAEALGSPDAIVATTPREWRAAMYGTRMGKPVASYLVALAVLLVIAEAMLSTTREARSSRRLRSLGSRS